MKRILNFILIIVLITGVSSCLNDLDQSPDDSRNTRDAAFAKDAFGTYQGLIAKIYASLILTGQEGPAGQGDIVANDEGFTSYIRQYWQVQELSTDEAINAWGDPGVDDINFNSWGAGNSVVFYMYYRIYFTVSLTNEFLRESTEEKLNSRNLSDAERNEVIFYRNEARFIRAMAYYHALDLFGNVGFVDDNSPVGYHLPPRIERSDLFDYVESELLAIEENMREPRSVYGRADKGATWMLLSKLYLNAEVYKGENRYTECLTYLNKVINQGGYSLAADYTNLFKADNNSLNEIIFPIISDPLTSQSFGGTTYLVNAQIGGSMTNTDFGVPGGGWGGNRSTLALYNTFDDPSGDTDARAMFWTDGQTLEISNPREFTEGVGVTKWKNITSGGESSSDAGGTFVDTDFPMFRLGDAYLMYAEAVLRGGTGGDLGQATAFINMLRSRAYGDTSGNISQSAINEDFIIAERARELYWEAHRRQDLIRFNQYSGNSYNWPFKAGTRNGASFDDIYKLFPLPPEELAANPNLTQNPGY
jgi:hypothetical protein